MSIEELACASKGCTLVTIKCMPIQQDPPPSMRPGLESKRTRWSVLLVYNFTHSRKYHIFTVLNTTKYYKFCYNRELLRDKDPEVADTLELKNQSSAVWRSSAAPDPFLSPVLVWTSALSAVGVASLVAHFLWFDICFAFGSFICFYYISIPHFQLFRNLFQWQK